MSCQYWSHRKNGMDSSGWIFDQWVQELMQSSSKIKITLTTNNCPTHPTISNLSNFLQPTPHLSLKWWFERFIITGTWWRWWYTTWIMVKIYQRFELCAYCSYVKLHSFTGCQANCSESWKCIGNIWTVSKKSNNLQLQTISILLTVDCDLNCSWKKYFGGRDTVQWGIISKFSF